MEKILLVLLAVVFLNGCSFEDPQRASSPKEEGKVSIKVQKFTYEVGYVKVVGIIKNVGNVSVFSPGINLQVYDSSGKVLLALTTAWPAGYYLKRMEPGSAAAFELIESIPGEPSRIRYSISVDEYNYDIEYPK